jgi:spermidine synthase
MEKLPSEYDIQYVISGFRFPVSGLYLLTVGFISILGQVVILRELNVAFYGIELICILAIGVWLFWTALGALVGRRTYTPSVRVIKFLFTLFSVLLPLEIVLIRYIRILFGGIPGAYLPFTRQLGAVILILLPAGILLGLIFQWAAKLYIEDDQPIKLFHAELPGKNLAMAYAIESIGGLFGGLASTLLLQFGMRNFNIMLLCATAAILPAFTRDLPKDRPIPKSECLRSVIFFLLMFFFFMGETPDHYLTRWNHPRLLDSQDSPYSRITVEGQKGQFAVFENGALEFETQSTAAEEFVCLAAIQKAHPGQVFISGGGAGGILEEILKHKPLKVDYAQLNPVMTDMMRNHLPKVYQESLQAPTVRVYHTDPRTFLKHSEETYDLILLEISEPDSGRSNRFYTLEYFRLCAEKLKPDGILAFQLRSSENLWTKSLTYRNTSIWQALIRVFRDAVILPGVTNTIIASNALLSRNPEELIERFNRRQISTRLVTPPYINYLYTNDRFFQIPNLLYSVNAPPNTDIRPVCYQYSGMIWLSKFFPGMIHWDISSLTNSENISYPYIFFFMIALFLSIRGNLKLRRGMLAAAAGFMGMVLETMLILHYQVKSGILFQNIGILLMVFMAGLAAGVPVTIRALKKPAAFFPKAMNFSDNKAARRWTGRGLLICFAVLHIIFIALLKSGYPSGIFVISLLMFMTGFLVSGLFAFASLLLGYPESENHLQIQDQKAAVSPVYAADLLGGCAGSLLGSLFLIPFLGMEHSAYIMTMLSVAALCIV